MKTNHVIAVALLDK